jgi:hypothetical protein
MAARPERETDLCTVVRLRMHGALPPRHYGVQRRHKGTLTLYYLLIFTSRLGLYWQKFTMEFVQVALLLLCICISGCIIIIIKIIIKIFIITVSFSFHMYLLYFKLVASKLKCASVVWNSITSTDANKLERIQQKFAALCFKRFFPHVNYSYFYALRKRWYHLDVLFIIQVCLGSEFCPFLKTVGLWVSGRYITEFAMFIVCFCNKNCLSARHTSAVNDVRKEVYVFGIWA